MCSATIFLLMHWICSDAKGVNDGAVVLRFLGSLFQQRCSKTFNILQNVKAIFAKNKGRFMN